MNWEAASFALTALVLAFQVWTAYTTTGLKYWVVKNFVAKEDLDTYLAPLRQSVQSVQSEERLKNIRHERAL